MNTIDILQVAETLANEKGIERDQVVEAIELAIQKAARAKYGFEKDIRATMDPESGEISLRRCMEVVEEVEDENTQLTVKDAQLDKKDAKVGDVLSDPLPPIDFGRVAAQTARQVIIQQVREAERDRQYDDFKDRVGEVITGIVRRVEYGNAYVDLGKTEAILRRDDIIPREHLRVGDRVKAYIRTVSREVRGPQIFLSRTHPQFLIELFRAEVPEIEEGVIEIRGAARDPGSRAKISVYTADAAVDPVGCCVGMRGTRVQAVVNELQGERVDIIPWSDNMATFIVNSLIPAEVSKVILDEDSSKVEVVVSEDQLSKVIGRRGQNVRLASQLTRMDLDIITEAEESEKRKNQLKDRSELFAKSLDVDDMIARLLATEGFTSVEDVAFVPMEELSSIEGFDEDIAEELQTRANDYLKGLDKELIKQYKDLGVDKELAKIKGLTPKQLVVLGEKGIKTRDDLADLAGDELLEILGTEANMTEDQANEVILAARAHWFDEKEAAKKS